MTVNQREFLKLQKKISRWIEEGEKKNLYIEFDVPDMPDYIKKEYLQDLKGMIPKKMYQFFEKYGFDVDTGEQYVRPEEEAQKARERARKGAETKRKNKIRDYHGGDLPFEDWYEKAYAYIQELIVEFSLAETNEVLVDCVIEILNDFIEHYAGDEECETFCNNYETNKGAIISLLHSVIDSYYAEDARESTYAFLDMVFDGTNYQYDTYKLEWAFEQMPHAYGGYRNAKYYG